MSAIKMIKIGKPGCVPCAAVNYAINENIEEIKSQGVEIIDASIAESPELIDKYNISGVPVLIFERNGFEMARLNGLVPIEEIMDAIDIAKRYK